MGEGRSRSFYVLAVFFTAYVLFLYGPMFAIYILSFHGPDGGLTFPMNGVSLVWFGKVFSGSGIIVIGAAFRRSLQLGLVVMVFTVVLSVSAGLDVPLSSALARSRRNAVSAIPACRSADHIAVGRRYRSVRMRLVLGRTRTLK